MKLRDLIVLLEVSKNEMQRALQDWGSRADDHKVTVPRAQLENWHREVKYAVIQLARLQRLTNEE